ncbi:MAG TPA: hypothetical protein VGR48_18645 [Terriglobales bacterium]|nr:hypothetical protein [Terriglobales bacterium]
MIEDCQLTIATLLRRVFLLQSSFFDRQCFSRCFCASVVIMVFVGIGQAQEKGPPVRVNVLNVCAPSAAEQREISAALARIPAKPRWGTDFEIARGRTTLSQDAAAALTGKASAASAGGPVSNWVRVRREFSAASPFLNALYSFSVDKQDMVETLVFAVRDPKDLLQVSLSETVSAVTSPAAALSAGTPPDHIRLERFGKSSVVLARCAGGPNAPKVDQSAYEPLFRQAATILATYRNALGTRRTVTEELARVQSPRTASPVSRKK